MTAPARILEFEQDNYMVRVDLSRLKVCLEVTPTRGGTMLSRIPPKPRFPAVRRGRQGGELPGFVPYAALAQKAKVFDDRLVAALDRAAWKVKGAWLLELASLVGGRVPLLAGCCSLYGRDDWESPASIRLLKKFLADERLSKPLGFYAGHADLEGVFQRDRLLQSRLSQEEAGLLRRALRDDPQLGSTYRSLLTLQSRITAPPPEEISNLMTEATEEVALFPHSRSPEDTLAKKLLGTGSIPEGFQLVDELAAAVRTGRVSLAPQADSGYYEHQLWSLEPLLNPQDPGLHLREDYQNYLVDLFKGLFSLCRETHIKQLPETQYGCPWPERFWIHLPPPELSLEPLATSYRRRAESYHQLSQDLAEWLGPEVDHMGGLFHGAYLTVCTELAQPQHPITGRDAEADLAIYQQFAEQRHSDPDLQVESRHLVPLYYDLQRGLHKVLLFMGWVEHSMTMSYECEDWPAAISVTHKESGKPHPDWQAVPNMREVTVLSPVTHETFASKLLNRQEFCDLCWATGEPSATLKALREM